MTDFRALCAELLKAIAPYRLLDDLNAEARIRTADRLNSVVYRAKTALEGDTPENIQWKPAAPPSLKKQALIQLSNLVDDLRRHGLGYCDDTIRRALEQLDD